ncbi:hypothetical protein HPB50_003803 [Hyalomma asiaticum]|uniref:Uncharacterized protein n=1 Tax=Hyalomma asiaticum TaxID=266040 RepID=A0ACB7S924_HYAAI|nr:hypothetical protein HPB50_003803 [Hyalomma asiaticum]
MTSMKASCFALLVVLAASGVFGSPLKDFFESVRKEPLTTYQCYRNGSSLEDPSATKLSVLWSGKGLPENKVECLVSFNLPGVEGKQTFHTSVEYVPQKDFMILAAGVDTATGDESYKIYDTSVTCENAHALRKIVCAEPCTLQIYGYGVGSLGYGAGHYGFGHGLLGYGLNYGYGLGSTYDYTALLRRKKSCPFDSLRADAHVFCVKKKRRRRRGRSRTTRETLGLDLRNNVGVRARRHRDTSFARRSCSDGKVPFTVVTGSANRGNESTHSDHVPQPQGR